MTLIAVTAVTSPPAWSTPLAPLAEVVARAQRVAPTVAMAAARSQQTGVARASEQLSRWHNPTLEGRLGGATVQSGQVDVWVPVELGDQRRARSAEAGALRSWLASDREAARAESAGQAVWMWGKAVVAAGRARLARQVVATAQTEVDNLAKRALAKDVRDHELRLARMELARNQLQQQLHDAALQRALADLNRLVQTDADSVPFEPEPPAVVGLPAEVTPERLPAAAALHQQAALVGETRQRLAAEAQPPLQTVFGVGRGDAGELRVTAGLAWSPPVSRSAQVEQAQAQADRHRLLTAAEVEGKQARALLQALAAEDLTLAQADAASTSSGRLAGQAGVAAAVATWQAGKGEFVEVLLARRQQVELELLHLALVERRWEIRSLWTTTTGTLP